MLSLRLLTINLSFLSLALSIQLPYMIAAHDAVLALALAAHKVIIAGGSATNGTLVRDMLRSVKFQGASGDISFTEQLDLDSSLYTIVQTVDFGQGKLFSNHQK